MADIDHFKLINDRHGHETGDEVLRHVATALTALCRTQDVVARWGGEEFLLALPATNAEAATILAERIRAAIANTAIAGKDAPIHITLSLGVSVLAADEDIDRAIARADRALYQSKEQGRNKVTVQG
jgi:diguanylate cyclase